MTILSSTNLGIITVAPKVFSPGKSYQYSVVISSGDKSTAGSQILQAFNLYFPEINCAQFPMKVNIQQKLIVNCTIESSMGSAVAWWTSPSVSSTALSSMSLLPLTQSIEMGTSLVQLALASGSLTKLLAYSFTISAYYTSGSSLLSSTFSFDVQINFPPSSGAFAVTPNVGTAFNTTFRYFTSGWIDDISDLPLTYSMYYYTISANQMTTVKSLDQRSYATGLLGQGISSNNYQCTVGVNAVDIYSGTATLIKSVTVSANLSPLTSLPNAVDTQLAAAYRVGNINSVVQILAAVATVINAVNCLNTPPTYCASLNRQICATVTNTCGECLNGYYGEKGPSNLYCLSNSNLPPPVSKDMMRSEQHFSLNVNPHLLVSSGLPGSSCTRPYMCLSGQCKTGFICQDAYQTCPNLCSAKGTCNYIREGNGHSDMQSIPCDIANLNCKPTCVCFKGYYGSDCSLGESAYKAKLAVRESTCSNLRDIASVQFLTRDAVTTRAALFANVLSDPTQLSNVAVGHCASAFISTISTSSQIIGGSAVLYESYLQSWVLLIQFKNVLEEKLLRQLHTSLHILTSGIQGSLAVGEPPVSIALKNVRMITGLNSIAASKAVALDLPQTLIEQLYQHAPTTVYIPEMSLVGSSVNSAVGISALQYFYNRTVNSTDCTLQIQTFGDSAISVVNVSSTLSNFEALYYHPIRKPKRTVQCYPADYPYDISFNCSGIEFNYTCPGIVGGYYTFSCPDETSYPACSSLSYSSQNSNLVTECEEIYYTAENTTCLCQTKASTAKSGLNEIDMVITSSRIVDIWMYNGTLASYEIPSVETNYSPLELSALALVGFIFNILFSYIYTRRKASLAYKKEKESLPTATDDKFAQSNAALLVASSAYVDTNSLGSRSLAGDNSVSDSVEISAEAEHVAELSYDDTFFGIFPPELYHERYVDYFWQKIASYHPWYVYSEESKRSPVVGSILLFMHVLTVILLSVLMVWMFFADDGECQLNFSEESCLGSSSTIMTLIIGTKCKWSAVLGYCTFEPSLNSAVLVVTIVIVVCISSVIVELFLERLITPLGYLNWTMPTVEDKYKVPDPDCLPDIATTEGGEQPRTEEDIENALGNEEKKKKKKKDKKSKDNEAAEDGEGNSIVSKGSKASKSVQDIPASGGYKYKHPTFEETKEAPISEVMKYTFSPTFIFSFARCINLFILYERLKKRMRFLLFRPF